MHQPAGAGSIDSGCEGRLSWLDRSQPGLPCTKEGVKAFFLILNISEDEYFCFTCPRHVRASSPRWCWLRSRAALRDMGLCACGQRPPVLLKNSEQMDLEMKDELRRVFLDWVNHNWTRLVLSEEHCKEDRRWWSPGSCRSLGVGMVPFTLGHVCNS